MKVEWNTGIELPQEFENIPAFVVGGFPRDKFLGNEADDVDIVVTNITVDEMLDRGFNHIMSADERTPVFQDSLNREVAIARTEKSTGEGHKDFKMNIVNPNIPTEKALEIDLNRRDLTINAIAVDIRTGEVFDFHNGLQDLEDGIIRHVSDAFSEDPLRILRAARYSARFEFTIDEETMQLMKNTTDKLQSISDDRFGKELVKTLKQAKNPRRFFDVLKEVEALEIAFPELARLDTVPAGPQKHHKEGSAFEHTMLVLEHMHDKRGNDVTALLAALGHDVGKGVTEQDVLPHHFGHEKEGKRIAINMRKRLALDKEFSNIMSIASVVHGNIGNIEELNASTIIDISKQLDSSPLTIEQIADLVECDNLGRKPQKKVNKETIIRQLKLAKEVRQNIKGKTILESRDIDKTEIGNSIPGERIGNMIRQERIEQFRQKSTNKNKT